MVVSSQQTGQKIHTFSLCRVMLGSKVKLNHRTGYRKEFWYLMLPSTRWIVTFYADNWGVKGENSIIAKIDGCALPWLRTPVVLERPQLKRDPVLQLTVDCISLYINY